jgi:superfamily II DNA or RNA helicase
MKQCQKCHKQLPNDQFDGKVCCKVCVSKYLRQSNHFWVQYPELADCVNQEFKDQHPKLTLQSKQDVPFECPDCEKEFISTPVDIIDTGCCPFCKKALIPFDKKQLYNLCIDKIQQADSYDDYTASLKFKPHELGFIQEVFAFLYFNIHKHLFNIKHYFSYSITKDKTLPTKLGLPKNDMGTDAIIVHQDKEISLVQVKWRSKDVVHDRLVFSGMSIDALSCKKNIKHLYLFSNVSDITKSAPTGEKFKYLLYNEMQAMDWQFFKNNVEQYRKAGKTTIQTVPEIEYRNWQREANKFVKAQLKTADVCSVIAACGAGKTLLVYSLIAKYDKILIVVPTLQLLSQWFYNFGIRETDTEFLLVGSDNDTTIDSPYTLTTSREVIQKVFENVDGKFITICTYQSLERLTDTDFTFDITFIDEAHLTTGNGVWSLVTKEDFPSEKKVYLTATPKIFRGQLKEKVVSMDDDQVYGKQFIYSCRQAIDDGILCDYNVILGASDKIQEGFPERYDLYAKFLHLCIEKYDLQRILVASNSHESSAKLYNTFKRLFSVDHNLVLMKANATSQDKNVVLANIHKMPTILFNVRIFNLGTDIPCLDSVFFNGDKNSKIDIVQTAMRCLRIFEGKKKAYIIVPSFFGDNLEVEAGDYSMCRNTLAALGSQDKLLLNEMVQRFRNGSKKPKGQRIQVLNLEGGEVVIDDLSTRIFDRLGNDVYDIRLQAKFQLWFDEFKKKGSWVLQTLKINGINIGGFQNDVKGTLTKRSDKYKDEIPIWLEQLRTLPFWPEMEKQLQQIQEKRPTEKKTTREKIQMLLNEIEKLQKWIPKNFVKDGVKLGNFQKDIKCAIISKTRYKKDMPYFLEQVQAFSFWPEMEKQLNKIEINRQVEKIPFEEKLEIWFNEVEKKKTWIYSDLKVKGINIGGIQDHVKEALTRGTRYKKHIPKILERLESYSFWPEMKKQLDTIKTRHQGQLPLTTRLQMLYTEIEKVKKWIPRSTNIDGVDLGGLQKCIKSDLRGTTKMYKKEKLIEILKHLQSYSFWPEMEKQLKEY